MTFIAVTQRVDTDNPFSERRDALDQRWTSFLNECGLVPILLPNNLQTACQILKDINICGILLTGGNSLKLLGGNAPERDGLENHLIGYAQNKSLPLLGVCRGMQVIQNHFGVVLSQVSGHVCSKQNILVNGEPRVVNSYHEFGTTETTKDLCVWAMAEDGVIKALSHRHYPFHGIMWHPEREDVFHKQDINLFCEVFAP